MLVAVEDLLEHQAGTVPLEEIVRGPRIKNQAFSIHIDLTLRY
jgi:hypothetical protein